MGIEKNWFDIIDRPYENLVKQKKDANIMEALKTFALLGGLTGLALAIGLLIGGGFTGPLFPAFATIGIIGIIVFPIMAAFFTIVGTLIVNAITWGVARILGGNATFTEQMYVTSRLAWPVFAVNIVIQVIGWIPIIGMISILFSILWSLYGIVLFTDMMAATHNLSSFKAYLSFGIPLAVIIAFFALAFLAIAAVFMGSQALGQTLLNTGTVN